MAAEVTRFEDFELDRGAFELRRKGRPVRLERIPLEMLFLLVERRGLLVGREEILERVWGKDVFVDADNSINTAVRKIRQALGDNPEEPRFVLTVPGKGYRFAASVVVPAPPAPLSPKPVVEAEGQAEGPSVARPLRYWLLWIAIVVLLGAAASVAGLILKRNSKPASTKTMLVVLPFVNLSDDPQQEYFADGMTEEMITQLGNLDPEHLGVIARTSSMQYKHTQKRASQIAQELGVNYLLEGSVRRDGNKVRVTGQLIRANDETHVWAGDFDKELRDVLRLQSDVALAISSKIELSLEGPTRKRLTGAPTLNPEAHDAYLRGLLAMELRTKEGMDHAIEEYEKAISLDPNYAAAYAELARAYSLATVPRALSVADSMPKARDAAVKAIAMDDSLGEGHTILGFIKAHYEYDWPGAEREMRRGVELNPNDPYAHLFYSNSYLSPAGRHEEAIAEMKKAIAIDPLSAPVQSFLGRTYLWARRYDEALEQFNKCAQLFPGFAINYERLSHLYTYREKFEEAIAAETKARLLSGGEPKDALRKEGELRKALKESGPQGYWKKVLEFSSADENSPEAYTGPYGMAIVYARLGEKQKALHALENALDQHILAMTEIGVEPALDPLRGEARFQDLMRKVGLTK
ncbi:MAG TPA: winged helix-turn-helix domain-containing protein [Methylomirabilota bacterium]|nr:winged helix-turn-helix domain-containing protein [Methylomirabilota bacterium]